jgi:hypothetical protein
MKRLLFILPVIICLSSIAQKKYYATILDADNNPQARGLFLSVLDTGVTIEVEKDQIFLSTSNIYTIRIEKNTLKLEFMKLGTATIMHTAATLLDRPADSTDAEEKEKYKAGPLLISLQELLNSLLDQNNQIASFKIDGSAENLKKSLSILQQYSFQEEPTVKSTGVISLPVKPKTTTYPKPINTKVPQSGKFPSSNSFKTKSISVKPNTVKKLK